jgi:hypothetical protein
MKQEAIERLEHAGFVIRLLTDENPINPREWDNLGTMVCFHRKYELGDKHEFTSPGEFSAWLEEQGDNVIALPLYLYDHGGITMSTGSFSCPWDSGQVGWIYVTKEKVREEYAGVFGGRAVTQKLRERVKDQLRVEVNVYDLYLTGGFVGYVVEDDGEHVDSCWGFDDKSYAIEQAKLAAEALREEVRKCEQACAL